MLQRYRHAMAQVLVLLLSRQCHSVHLRILADFDTNEPFDPPPIAGPLPPGFGFDDESDNQGPPSYDPEGDQGIRNGYTIAPLPWYAVFQSKTLCGASLIHGDILLTAAHCVDDNGFPAKVRVGSTDYYSGGKVTKVVDGVLYPGWTWKKASDPDLAILVLEDFLSNDVAILNSDSTIPAADYPSVFAMGFGLVNDQHSSRTLLGASIPYLDNCSYRSYTYNHTRHLCANSRDIATCGGDSGSPVTLGSTSRLQVGINSYSNGKCSSQTLDVYTRVSFFHDWIQQQICNKSRFPPKSCLETDTPTAAPSIMDPPVALTMSPSTLNPTYSETGSPSSVTFSPTDSAETSAPSTTATDGTSAAPGTTSPTTIAHTESPTGSST